MGSKGGQTTQTSQTQTYAPAGSGYVTNALNRAADVANNPFAIPQAPVAGFSGDQQGAFQQFRDAQGAAQPYYNMAANAYSPQGTQDYYNPYAANVMANMKDMFGQQMSQNDQGLTQAAGGVGADRIAVGHAALAKQQDLAAGQTMADLWQRAGSQAQQAGQGFQSLGANVQNSQLQGTNALLASGGLQQQLSQAQMNSPYQQQLAQAAFPYQQAQFLASLTGSLAPGLGGTTTGQGTTTTPAPSIWSQLLGGGMAAYGGYKALSGGGGGGKGGNSTGDGSWYGPSSVGGAPLSGYSNNNPYYGPLDSQYAQGGGVEGYDAGGSCTCTPENAQTNNTASAATPAVAPSTLTPSFLPPAAPAAPAQSVLGLGSPAALPLSATSGGYHEAGGSDSNGFKGSNFGVGGSNPGNYHYNPFTLARGGAVYADGGEVERGGIPNHDPIDVSKFSLVPQTQLTPIQTQMPQLNLNPPQQQSGGGGGGGGPSIGDIAKIAMMFAERGGRVNSPYAGYAEGGAPDADEPGPGEPGFIYRMPDRPNGVNPYDKWREDTPLPPDPGPARSYADASAPGDVPAVAAIKTAAAGAPTRAASPAAGLTQVAEAGGEGAGALGDQGVSPYSQSPASPPQGIPQRERSMASDPWLALMAAGLGIAGGTSPYAGVNIGQGAMAGVKTLQQQRESAQKDETIDQAARRLQQEAQHHQDSFGLQQQQLAISKANSEKQSWSTAGSIMTKDGLHPLIMSTDGKMIDGVTRKPPTDTDTVIPKGGSKNSPEEIASVVDGIVDGSQPPTLTGLYGDSVHVRAGLKAKNFNLAKAQQEWAAAQKLTASVNAPRMVAYVGLNKSVDRTIDEVKELADQLKQGGVPLLNKIQLQGYIKTNGNSPMGQLATRYMTAVNTLKEEFANLANGGYAPTEAAWKLANEQVNGDFGVKQMHASLDEIQRLIRYRIQAIPGLATQGPSAPNRYTAPAAGAGTPPPATAAPPPASSAPRRGAAEAAEKFKQLIGPGGKSEEEAYAILKEEGYTQ